MAWVAVSCPQCSAPLPRVALWRSVKCGSCGALITKTESLVQRDTFRQALLRARHSGAGLVIQCSGQSYSLMERLGAGEVSEVHLAQRLGPMPFLAVIKLSTAGNAAAVHVREAAVLRELQGLAGDGADAYFGQLLPEVVTVGAVAGDVPRHALVLKAPTGYWGSVADLNARFPQGLDPRHAVWIWRRVLGMLAFVHSRGWVHGDVRPEHVLVHPGDHGARLIGWASAHRNASGVAQAADLMRSARVIQILLGGASESGSGMNQVPAELSPLVKQAAQDTAFCQQQGALGLDAALRSAARAAFGPPAFVPLDL
jgi:hypothetical protein